MVGTGALCVLLLVTVLGGYSRLGASTNAGWFALIVALMCIPFGLMLLALGLAKWLKNRRESGCGSLARTRPGPRAIINAEQSRS